VVRLLTLEDHTFAEDAQGARTSKNIPDWSVAKIKSVGADGTCVRAAPTETLHAIRGHVVGCTARARASGLLDRRSAPLEAVHAPEGRTIRIRAPVIRITGSYSNNGTSLFE
jgi:hypothetical protein